MVATSNTQDDSWEYYVSLRKNSLRMTGAVLRMTGTGLRMTGAVLRMTEGE